MLAYGNVFAFGEDWVEKFRASLTIDGVHIAEEVIREHGLRPTPVLRHPLLADAAGCDLYLKHENHLPTGAFKIRGGLNYMKQFSQQVDAPGVITATRGNHGQSVALAAKTFGVAARVVVPLGNNVDKNNAMRAYGAELIEHGKDYDEARRYAEKLQAEEGWYGVHSANEPLLIMGVATAWLEVLEDLDAFDAVVVPVGGGSSACAAVTVLRQLRPDVEIIGVQAENAPAVYESWKAGEMIETESANTVADGLATRVPFELPFAVLQEGLDDMLLVSEVEILAAIALILETTHNLVEGAAAAVVAAILRNRDRFAGKRVVGVMSGANIDRATLERVLAASASAS